MVVDDGHLPGPISHREAAVSEDGEAAVGEDERETIWNLLWRFLTSVWETTKSISIACVCRWWTFPIQIPHCEAAVGEDERKTIWSLLWRFLTSVWETTKSIFMACVCW